MKESKSSISKAKSYEETGEFWDNHDLSEHWDETQAADFDVALKSEASTPLAANPTYISSQTPITKPVEVFYSYAHEDEGLRDELKKHLANLKRQRVITDWYDRDISAGKEWDDEINKHLDSASVILLLISPDFMNSDYCSDVEVRRAMERHEAGEARVIPVILRPVDWKGAPFSKLQSLPSDVEPITLWKDQDEAFLDVTKGIRKAVQELSGPSAIVPTIPEIPRPPRVGFVSRRDKDGHNIVERLREELAPHKNQLVALWGAGGVGKTTLAAEAVRLLSETSGQRIIWISADGRANFTFSTLLDGIAEQLGRTDLRPLAAGAKDEALRPLIAAAPTLIILDNLETISPQEELLCKDFLTHHARCPALITTRERIDNAHLITIPAMAPDEASELLHKLIVQTQDPEIYAEVDRARILQAAEFNPLIIQWIVGQIDLAQDPEEVLSDLAHGEGDAAERVFDRSFNLRQMAEGGRAVLLALSLFMPSATRVALAEVAGMVKDKDKKKFKKAQQTLASLWLVKQTDGGQRLAVGGLTRELTKVKLDRDFRSRAFRHRFVSRFLRYAESNAESNPSDLNALEAEKENLLQATRTAEDLNDSQTVMHLAVRLAGPVRGMLGVRGYWDEATRLNAKALDIARRLNIETNISIFAHNLAIMYENRGEILKAKELFGESLGIAEKQGDMDGVAITLHQLGVNAQLVGNLVEARRFYTESLEIKRVHGEVADTVGTLRNLGTLFEEEGDLASAHRLYNESLGIAKTIKSYADIANADQSLGSLAESEGKIIEALRLYSESLEIRKKLGDQRGLASSLHSLGSLAHAKGELDEARRLYNESLEIRKKLGNQLAVADSMHSLGILAEDLGDLSEASRLYTVGLEIRRKFGAQYGVAGLLHSFGSLAHTKGELDEARRLFSESLEISTKLGDRRGIAKALLSVGSLAQDEGELAEARRLYDESLEIEKKLGDQRRIASSLHQLGTLGLPDGNLRDSEDLLNQSLSILRGLEAKKDIAECLESLGKLRVEQGSFVEARLFYDEALELAQALGVKFRIASLKRSLGLLSEKHKKSAQAALLLRESISIFEELGSPKMKDAYKDLERVEGKSHE